MVTGQVSVTGLWFVWLISELRHVPDAPVSTPSEIPAGFARGYSAQWFTATIRNCLKVFNPAATLNL